MKIGIKWLVAIIVAPFVFVALLITVNLGVASLRQVDTQNTDSAISYLTGQGYVVLAAGEYTSISNRLDALKVSADAASANATIAAGNAATAASTANTTLNTLLLHNENIVYLYPDSTSVNVTLTAGAPSDNFSAFAVIEDSSSGNLTALFGSYAGYINQLVLRDYSVADQMYVIEIAYGASKTIVGRVKVRSDWTYVLDIKSAMIPAGEIIYYRMKAVTAGTTLKADFRYYLKTA